MPMHETCGLHLVRDLIRHRDRADGDASAEVLGHGEEIRTHVLALKSPHAAELGQAGLGLVEDEKDSAFPACRHQLWKPTQRRFDDDTGAEERLRGYPRGPPSRPR